MRELRWHTVKTVDGGFIPYTSAEIGELSFDGFCALVELRAEAKESGSCELIFEGEAFARLARVKPPGRKSPGGQQRFLQRAARKIVLELVDKGYVRRLNGEAGLAAPIELELLIETPHWPAPDTEG
ncbi:hypothetical protein [Maricaulis sp.]|uniref:hypothetical protein n=1 Tax=Maricaulis sp. TaxID=1486257 RepID=UPI00262F71A3|nr:hypothetical protein [Maricaulis sp.]